MTPVLPPGTIIIGRRWFMRPKLGQIVVFRLHEREVIKRIAGIEADGLFVVGDNPSASTDSRQYGLIDPASVMAVVIWPLPPRDYNSPDK